jgi:hypothetical protein
MHDDQASSSRCMLHNVGSLVLPGMQNWAFALRSLEQLHGCWVYCMLGPEYKYIVSMLGYVQ